MKPWPKNGKTVRFSDLVKDIKKAVLFAYDVKRKNRKKNIPWNGYDIGDAEKVCCLCPDDHLTAENLRYSESEQGRDALDEIIGLALQLGMEQGRRNFCSSTPYELLIRMAKALLEKIP